MYVDWCIVYCDGVFDDFDCVIDICVEIVWLG